ncbi:MAG: DUF4397 domain-containing protein [Pedobacter sp.]|nr:MAG: DUF4397 domain-containing protein [Pedobacter sp.]
MIIMSYLKHISKSFITVLAFTITLSSCMKDNDIQPQPIAGLNVIHASPTTELLDFYVDNQKANSSDFAYGNQVGYVRLFPGNRQISIAKKGSNTPLLSERFDLEGDFGYSLFVANKLETVQFLLLKDDLKLPETGKARVRFVNMSPDAPALSLFIAGKETEIAGNKKFKEYSTFVSVDAAEQATLNIKNTETGATETSFADVKIEAGKVYTIWIKGLKANTDDKKIGVAVFQHK